MVHSRYVDVDDTVASSLHGLQAISQVALAFRARVTEEVNRSEDRRKFAAYVLREAGEFEPLLFSNIASFLMSVSDVSFISDIFKGAGITLHPKQLKKSGWRERTIETLLFRMHKPFVRRFIIDFITMACERLLTKILSSFTDIPTYVATLWDDTRVEFYDYLKTTNKDTPNNRLLGMSVNKLAIYQACLILKRDLDAVLVQNTFNDLDFAVYEAEILSGYYYLVGSQESETSKVMGISLLEAIEKMGIYEQQYEQEQAVSSRLKDDLQRVNQSAEEQLNDALKRMDEMDQEIAYLRGVIEEQDLLYQQLHASMQPAPPRLWLKKIHCLVIGHPAQKQMYREEIERFGGEYAFFPAVLDGVNVDLLQGPMKRAERIFYITTYTSHTVQKYLKAYTEANKVLLLNCTGRNSFVLALLDYFENRNALLGVENT